MSGYESMEDTGAAGAAKSYLLIAIAFAPLTLVLFLAAEYAFATLPGSFMAIFGMLWLANRFTLSNVSNSQSQD